MFKPTRVSGGTRIKYRGLKEARGKMDCEEPVPLGLRVMHALCFVGHMVSAIVVPIYMRNVPSLPFYKTVSE